MAQENQDKFQASLTIETDIAADQVTLKHYAGINIASIQRDPDAGGLIYTFELAEPVPDGEEIVAKRIDDMSRRHVAGITAASPYLAPLLCSE